MGGGPWAMLGNNATCYLPPLSTFRSPFWAWQCNPAENRMVLPQALAFWLWKLFKYKKMNKFFSVQKSMPRVRTMFYEKDFKQNLNIKNIVKFFCWIKRHVEPCCCMVLCSTIQGPKNMWKKTSQTSARQSSMGVDSISWQYKKYLKRNLNIKNIAKFFCWIKKTYWTVLLYGFMQNHAGARNMNQKTSETSGGQSSMRGRGK